MPKFQNRSQFIKSAVSEKITLAHVNAKDRLYVFDGPTLNIYSKQVPFFVEGLKQDDVNLTKVDNLASVVVGTFYYDIEESTLYTRLIGDAAPNLVEVIATYKFFYSDKSLQTSYNLEDISEDVHYEGRIVSSPGYKHKIGIDQALTSLIGEGTLHLKNQDGGLDSTFDKLIFENQDVTIYSWNQDLQPSEARVIYRGKVTNKTFDGTDVKFKIKDQIFSLLESPAIEAYGESDNVADSVKGQYKRRVYGRVDGLKCQSVSQINKGYNLTGVVSFNAKSPVTLTIKSITSFTTVQTNSHGDLNIGDEVYVGQIDKKGGYKDYITNLSTTTVTEIERLNLDIPVDRDGFIVYDDDGSVALVFDLFGAGNQLPAWALASNRIINVVVPFATKASLASAISTALSLDSKFTAIVTVGNDVEITHLPSGALDKAEYQGSNMMFSVTTIQNGETNYFVTVKNGWFITNPVPVVDSQLNRLIFVYGTGTSFLSEILQGDTIKVGTQVLDVSLVQDNNTLLVGDTPRYSASNQVAINLPSRGTTLRNRTYLSTGHICAEVTHNILSVPQFNRVILDDTSGLFSGDFIEFVSTSERLEIKTVAPGNIVVLQQNMLTKPPVSTQVVRRPIQEVYINSSRVNANDYSIFNSISGSGIIFDTAAEFNLSRPKRSSFIGNFIRNSRNIQVSSLDIALSDTFSPGDWVKPDGLTYSEYYKVINVNDKSLDIDRPFNDLSIEDVIEYKSPDYLEDDSVVSVNILGKTIDGTATGKWIQTVAEAQKDLLTDINISALNLQSFIDGETDGNQLVSMSIPQDFDSKTLPTVKDITDKLNKSIHSSLTLDNDLNIKFQVLNVYTGEDLVTIRDSDVIDWDIKSTNGKTYRNALTRYRFTDVELSTLESGNKFLNFESEFVKRYIETNKTDEIDIYLYEERDAEIAAHRHLFYNQLSNATLIINTDLRLENIEIGQVVIADFQRMYKRFGNESYRKKVMLVTGKTITGERTQIELNDLGNAFNIASFITPNDAPEYNLTSDDQKLIYGYITDNQGIVDNDENTANSHLIS